MTCSRQQVLRPSRALIVTIGDPNQDRSGTVDELAPQVLVASFTYAAQSRFASRRILFGNQPDPCRECPAGREVSSVINGGDQSRGDHRPDAGKGCQTLALHIIPADRN